MCLKHAYYTLHKNISTKTTDMFAAFDEFG